MRISKLLIHIRSSLWFVPVLCVLAGAVLSFGTIALDRFFETGDAEIPRGAGADWLVVDRDRFDVAPELDSVYRDERFTLYVIP